jgi:hypothetical protein
MVRFHVDVPLTVELQANRSTYHTVSSSIQFMQVKFCYRSMGACEIIIPSVLARNCLLFSEGCEYAEILKIKIESVSFLN